MSCDVICMALANVPVGEQRSRFLAVGLADNTVRIISLDPNVSREIFIYLHLEVRHYSKNCTLISKLHLVCANYKIIPTRATGWKVQTNPFGYGHLLNLN